MILTGHTEKKANYYSEIYRRGYDTSGYYPIYETVLKFLARIPSPKILEPGCGLGDLGRMILAEGYPYRGFDFSEEAIEQCHRAKPDGVFAVGNLYDQESYHPVDYNTVVALEVLEHVDDLAVMEMLPPGVRLIASVPDYDDVAHLRLYRDIQRDIIDRFRPFLHVIEVATATAESPTTGGKQSIHIFFGVKTLP